MYHNLQYKCITSVEKRTADAPVQSVPQLPKSNATWIVNALIGFCILFFSVLRTCPLQYPTFNMRQFAQVLTHLLGSLACYWVILLWKVALGNLVGEGPGFYPSATEEESGNSSCSTVWQTFTGKNQQAQMTPHILSQFLESKLITQTIYASIFICSPAGLLSLRCGKGISHPQVQLPDSALSRSRRIFSWQQQKFLLEATKGRARNHQNLWGFIIIECLGILRNFFCHFCFSWKWCCSMPHCNLPPMVSPTNILPVAIFNTRLERNHNPLVSIYWETVT